MLHTSPDDHLIGIRTQKTTGVVASETSWYQAGGHVGIALRTNRGDTFLLSDSPKTTRGVVAGSRTSYRDDDRVVLE